LSPSSVCPSPPPPPAAAAPPIDVDVDVDVVGRADSASSAESPSSRLMLLMAVVVLASSIILDVVALRDLSRARVVDVTTKSVALLQFGEQGEKSVVSTGPVVDVMLVPVVVVFRAGLSIGSELVVKVEVKVQVSVLRVEELVEEVDV